MIDPLSKRITSFQPERRRILGANPKTSALQLLFLLIMAVSLTGCAVEKPALKPRKDDFFSKWRVEAKSARGHSPEAPEMPKIEAIPASVPKKNKKSEAPVPKPERPLPSQKVSLRMHNADVVVVLRTLARAVHQNIVMNDKVKGTISIEMDDVPWDEAFRGILHAQGLNYVWEGDLIRVLTLEDLETELKISNVRNEQKAQKKEAKQADPLVLSVIPIDYAKPKELQDMMKDYLSKNEKGAPIGSISVDEHTNSLVINAVPDDVRRLTTLVHELDKPISQIHIESNIVEATKEVAMGLGVQWGGMYSGGDIAVTPGGTGGKTDPTTGAQTYNPATGQTGISGQGFASNFPIDLLTGGSGAALGLMFGKIGGDILDMQLLALQKEGKVNILSSPSIITMDNQTAFTENGERVPYVSTSQLSGTEVKFEDVVLRLEITPHVISRDTLKMDITVKKDQVDNTRNVQGNPYIIKKQTHTTLIARDGETIVISGLSKETDQNTKNGVPGIKDAPLFGWLFRSRQTDNLLEEVLIFITPHILKQENVESLQERPNRAFPGSYEGRPLREPGPAGAAQ